MLKETKQKEKEIKILKFKSSCRRPLGASSEVLQAAAAAAKREMEALAAAAANPAAALLLLHNLNKTEKPM